MRNIVKCLTLFLMVVRFGYAQLVDDGNASSAFDYSAELARNISIPNAPEAEAFVKYGDIPLNHFTGTPSISVPICQVAGKRFSLPISMTYDASGIKVNQLATNVGLGWNLNYGGVVSRQVQGLPDQSSGSYVHITNPSTRDALEVLYNSPQMTSYDNLQDLALAESFMENYNLNNIDTQADTFSFSINGLSGTIAINYDVTENGKYQVFCIEDPTIKIDYTITGTTQPEITSWILTDTQGTIYTFAKKEYTESQYSTSQNEYVSEYVSSWYISDIKTADTEDHITFAYDAGQYYTQEVPLPVQTMQEIYYHPVVNNTRYSSEISQHSQTLYKIKQFNLLAIYHNNKQIVALQHALSRQDLPGRSAITGIDVFNTVGQRIKDFDFNYSYFTATTNGSSFGNKRLKLDEIREVNAVDNTQDKVHSFEYHNPNSLPHIASGGADLWGYQNGSNSNSIVDYYNAKALGNSIKYNEQYGISPVDLSYSGANRSALLSSAINGTLKKITYPTGGSSTFTYGLHQGPKLQGANGTFTNYFSVQGGSNSHVTEDVATCNNDDLGQFYNLQNAVKEGFTIDDNNKNKPIVFDIEYTSNNGGVNNNEVRFIAIYKSRFGTGCETRLCPDSGLQPNGCSIRVPNDTYEYCDNGFPAKSYCELIGMGPNHPDVMYMSSNPGADVTLTLPKGDYRVLMVNGRPDSSLRITYSLIRENAVPIKNEVGGLRLLKTESRPNSSATPITNYYYYDTIAEDQAVTLDMMNNQTTSSGIIHQKLVFSKKQKHTGRFSRVNPLGCGGGSNLGGGSSTEYVDGDIFTFYSSNLAPKTKHNITYSNVSEVRFRGTIYEGHTTYTFYNQDEGFTQENRPFYTRYHLNGKVKTTTHYNDQKSIVQQTTQNYTQQALDTNMPLNGLFMMPVDIYHKACVTTQSSQGNYSLLVYGITGEASCNLYPCVGGVVKPMNTYFANNYRFTPVWTRLEETIDKQFFDDQILEKKTNYFYDNATHKQLTRTETIQNNGEITISKLYYPQDRSQLGTLSTNANKAIDKMITTHRIGMPLQVEAYSKRGSTTSLLSKQRTDYRLWGNAKKIFPEFVYTAKGTAALEKRMQYHNYDTYGNPLEVSQTDGTHSIYIWGYNELYPIAKIDNATYSGMPGDVTSLINTIRAGSNTENTLGEENTMRGQFETLRTKPFFANGQMSYYIYDPMVGVKSMTDPRGYTMFYEYDTLNRLSKVKDQDGNILSENTYNYKNN
ncbi:hypothetical protein [Aquimarina litoralis]|uniref:hypothetical protein n=1 Tax=Aquimarina litoralis TaxID=584605 RepID=UPI001C56A30D|nr:hypothetical protein [Aquimarina litoralis]MBW1295236.1 hypothetical protein [Aquimarina litoralis]